MEFSHYAEYGVTCGSPMNQPFFQSQVEKERPGVLQVLFIYSQFSEVNANF
jgi:hypothetical protein